MTIREFAERVLFAETLADKLAAPPPGLLDEARGAALVTPREPGRPRELRLAPVGGDRAEFPREHQLADERARGHLLHFLANHELLATELMALALLKFPDAPPAFRRGLLRTLHEEQLHAQWYMTRMADYGVSFGELPVNGFFWNAVADMDAPIDYVTRLPLTFEQANLDFSLHYRDVFRRAGDEAAATLFQTIHDDEISHVAYGLNWFRKWKEPGEDDWEGFSRRLVFPLSPVRAKARRLLDREGRRRAGLGESFIQALDLFSGSRGRTPHVFLFNPEAEVIVRGGVPDRPILRLAEDLDVLPAFLGHQEDVVLVKKRPRPEHLDALRRWGVAWPEFEVLARDGQVEKDSLLRQRRLGGLRPWAWSPDSETVLGPLRENVGGAAREAGWSEAARTLFSKQTGVELLAELGDPWPGVTVRTVAELHAAMARWRAAGWERGVIKPAHGSSGRGFRRMERWQPADDAWAEATLAEHGALIVEPWLEKRADFSVQGEALADGSIQFKGFTRLETDARGRFLACAASGRFAKLFPPEIARFFSGNGDGAWLADFYRAKVFPLLERRFAAARFSGPFGIDALVYRAADDSVALRPVVELNPRCTMGRVTWELRRLAHSAATVRFSLTTLRSPVAQGARSLEELAQRLQEAHPARMERQGSKPCLTEGTLVLNDPMRAQRFLAVLEVRRGRA